MAACEFIEVVGKQLIDEWTASKSGVPARRMDSSASTRCVIAGVNLRTGDEIRIEGFRDGNEPAGLDYIEIAPEAPSAAVR